jgi:hypothetical protein
MGGAGRHELASKSFHVRRKLPLPREPAGAIPKEGTHLYWVAKLQGAVERQYSFYAGLLFGENSCAIIVVCLYRGVLTTRYFLYVWEP